MAKWPAERLSRALDLRGLGYSYAEIAVELDCFADCGDGGRNAVIGALYRANNPNCDSYRRAPEPSSESVLAAAIVIDAFEEAIGATGLSLEQVQHAVRMARLRESREVANAA